MKNKILILCMIAFVACDTSTTMGTSSSTDNSDGTGTGGNNNGGSGGNNTDLPAGFTKFIDEYTDVYISGDYVVIETTGVPNHNSPY